MITTLGPCSLLLIIFENPPPAESEGVRISPQPLGLFPAHTLEQSFKPSSHPVAAQLTISQWLPLGYRPQLSNVSDMLCFRPAPLAFPQVLKCVTCPLAPGPFQMPFSLLGIPSWSCVPINSHSTFEPARGHLSGRSSAIPSPGRPLPVLRTRSPPSSIPGL